MGYCGLSSASIARKATVGTPSSPSYQAAENGRVVKGTTASVVAQVFWDNKEYRPCAIHAHEWCKKCFEFKQVRSQSELLWLTFTWNIGRIREAFPMTVKTEKTSVKYCRCLTMRILTLDEAHEIIDSTDWQTSRHFWIVDQNDLLLQFKTSTRNCDKETTNLIHLLTNLYSESCWWVVEIQRSG